MDVSLSRALGFVPAGFACVASAILVSVWFLVGAVICLGLAIRVYGVYLASRSRSASEQIESLRRRRLHAGHR